MISEQKRCQRGHLMADAYRGKCRACIRLRKRRFNASRRKLPQVEPEVELIRRADVGQTQVHLPRGFWASIAERVKLLGPDEALCLTFDREAQIQPNTSMLSGAGAKAGVRIGQWWHFNRLYVWKAGAVQGRRKAA